MALLLDEKNFKRGRAGVKHKGVGDGTPQPTMNHPVWLKIHKKHLRKSPILVTLQI